jgi:hypothetical protein
MPRIAAIQVTTATRHLEYTVDENGLPIEIGQHREINIPGRVMQVVHLDETGNVIATVTWPMPDPDPLGTPVIVLPA